MAAVDEFEFLECFGYKSRTYDTHHRPIRPEKHLYIASPVNLDLYFHNKYLKTAIKLDDSIFQLHQYSQSLSVVNEISCLWYWSKIGQCYVIGTRFSIPITLRVKFSEFTNKQLAEYGYMVYSDPEEAMYDCWMSNHTRGITKMLPALYDRYEGLQTFLAMYLEKYGGHYEY